VKAHSLTASRVNDLARWPLVLLDSVAVRGSGHTPNKKIGRYWGGRIKWVSLKDTSKLDQGVISATAEQITPSGLANSSAVLHRRGSVVLLRDAGIGKSAILGSDMAVSQHFLAWSCGPSLHNEFLYYWFQSMKSEFERISNGSTIKTIGLRYFRQLKVPLPHIDEQRQIARRLSDIDRLIAFLERLIAKKQAIKQGMMQQLLTGKTRLPGFTDPWPVIRLAEVGQCLRGVGYDPQTDLSPGDRAFTLRLLRANNVQDGAIVLEDLQFVHERKVDARQVVQPGDIVICMANGSRSLVGKSAYFDTLRRGHRYTFGAFMGVFRVSNRQCEARFIAELLRSKDFRDWLDIILAGSSINNLKPGDVENFQAAIPSHPEQSAIAGVLQDAQREIDAARSRLLKIKAIKMGMMQEILTGHTRLSVAEGVA
jgi:type I restriction enzyme S subunit